MEFFQTCALSATGTVVTDDGEILIASTDNVTILNHDKRPTDYTSGLVTITTHRLVWTSPNRKTSISMPLSVLSSHNPSEHKPFSSKILLHVGRGVRLDFHSASSKERDQFVSQLSKAVHRKEWEHIAAAKQREQLKKAQQGEYVRRRLGAGGVADKVAKQVQDTGQSIATGFASLDQLRSQAEDLVQIARTFKTATALSERADEENELLGMMAEMGINAPVTKETTGGNVNVYREQLARQMADFLRSPILNVGGVMTLSDAYCLVMRNRATTELVSPEDFRIACGYFQRLGLLIDVIRLESGVLALSVDASKDTSGAKALRKMAEERGSVSPIEVVRVRHVPIQRATSMLEDAERIGLLARDSTTDGLRFFPNFFDSFTENNTQLVNT